MFWQNSFANYSRFRTSISHLGVHGPAPSRARCNRGEAAPSTVQQPRRHDPALNRVRPSFFKDSLTRSSNAAERSFFAQPNQRGRARPWPFFACPSPSPLLLLVLMVLLQILLLLLLLPLRQQVCQSDDTVHAKFCWVGGSVGVQRLIGKHVSTSTTANSSYSIRCCAPSLHAHHL